MENIQVVLATNNPGKLKEVSAILSPLGIEVKGQREALGYDLEVEETGTTFRENAYLKAKAIWDVLKLPVIADDSGLIIDALNGEPGVYSKRWGGGEDSRVWCEKVLSKMDGVAKEERNARFACAICLIMDGETSCFDGVCEGWIGFESAGEGGFGYDPVFWVGERSFAQLSSQEKNEISHRRRALDGLVSYLAGMK